MAWRVYPAALDTLGLREALEAVAERVRDAGAPHLRGAGPLPKPVETAAYFVVCEAVTNAAKHAGADADHGGRGQRRGDAAGAGA